MRILFLLPLAALAACNVENDSGNDSVTIEYNQQRIEKAASDAADTAQDIAAGAANVAVTTGRAVKNEVGDIDVDVNVTRDRDAAANSAN